MRWKALFEDMEAQIAASDRAAEESTISELTRLEQSAVSLVDRLRGQVGLVLKVRTAGGNVFNGALTHVGSEWIVLSSGPSPVMIPALSIELIGGMGRQVRHERSATQSRLGLASALRALSRDRAQVTVHSSSDGGRIDGTIDRVGKDFIEVAAVPAGEQRRSGNVSTVYAIPFAVLAAVASRH